MDFVIETDESIPIVAIDNSTTRGLWSGAFNAIAVGRTDGGYPQPTISIDATYHAGLTWSCRGAQPVTPHPWRHPRVSC